MRYEVGKQIIDIDQALSIIKIKQIENKVVSDKEFNEALKKVESCIKLILLELAKSNKTMQEIYTELKDKEGD